MLPIYYKLTRHESHKKDERRFCYLYWDCQSRIPIIFKLIELSSDMFKCLIFMQVLTSCKDAEIRSQILTKFEQDPKLTLQIVFKYRQNGYCINADSVTKEPKRIRNKMMTAANPC